MAVYLKDSEQIQDFLTFIGAQLAALDMMNEKTGSIAKVAGNGILTGINAIKRSK